MPLIAPYEAYQISSHMDPGHQVLQAKLAECQACYNQPCHEGEITAKADAIWTNTRSFTTSTLTVIDSLVDAMAKLPGQRVILLTSSGFLSGDQEVKLDRMMDKARHAEVTINALDTKGVYFTASGITAYDGASILASGTGGTYYHNNLDLKLGFRELGMVPETVYVAGFTPSGASDGRFHKLKVRLAPGNRYSVQSRLGYAATPANAAASNSPASKLDSEVLASDTVADLPVSFAWKQWPGPSGMTMIVHLDIGRMHFMPWNGRRAEKLNIVAVLLDSHGSVVAGERSELQLALRDSTFTQFAKTGLTTAMTIKAPPGRYLARGAAQEATEGKLAADSATVEIK